VVGMFIAAFSLPDTGHSPPALIAVAAGHLLTAAGYALVARRWARQAGDDIANANPHSDHITPGPMPARR
jgi:hypothetical protein